jgi:hypothetical protein
MNVGRFGRVGRFGLVGRWAGRLVVAVLLALAVTLAPVTPLAQPADALVCAMKPTRVGPRCFCRGAYGWRIAPVIMCQVAR